jgi:hypothetical protein
VNRYVPVLGSTTVEEEEKNQKTRRRKGVRKQFKGRQEFSTSVGVGIKEEQAS